MATLRTHFSEPNEISEDELRALARVQAALIGGVLQPSWSVLAGLICRILVAALHAGWLVRAPDMLFLPERLCEGDEMLGPHEACERVRPGDRLAAVP
jgi:hypothetical protein